MHNCKQILQKIEKVFFNKAIFKNKNTLYKSKGNQKFKGRKKNKVFKLFGLTYQLKKTQTTKVLSIYSLSLNILVFI